MGGLLLTGAAVWAQPTPPDLPQRPLAMSDAAMALRAPDAVQRATPPLVADEAEPALRAALRQALWPADIVRLATDYLRLYPGHEAAAEAEWLRQRAQATADVLRRADVPLFRAAFAMPGPGGAMVDDLRQAALGDAAAALRLAQQLRGSDDTHRRQLGWLQYATALGSHQAAYALALHYRRESQPLLAAQYETRAMALGFVPPPSLDHLRK